VPFHRTSKRRVNQYISLKAVFFACVICLLASFSGAAQADSSSVSPFLTVNAVKVGKPFKFIPKAAVLQGESQIVKHNSRQDQLWKQLLVYVSGKTQVQKMQLVNRFFNNVAYVADPQDTWLAPATFVERGGDCEDFVIAKYHALKLMGFTPDQLRVALVQNTISKAQHAVLLVSIDNVSYVLDNQFAKVRSLSEVGHYQPIATFNEQSLWVHYKGNGTLQKLASVNQKFSG